MDLDDFDDLELPSLEELQQSFWHDARIKRDKLLHAADIEINRLEDSGAESKAWRIYRQKLRDIPAMYDDPLDIRWPSLPTDQ